MRALIADPDVYRRGALEPVLLRHGYEIEAREAAPPRRAGST